ncbi:FRG domain-containing protein [Vibrio parahaemolyticus]|uniref:FRG domain-containing protein n=1 Tax=Vibrio parahaemolyticus TaxID=670 RepID=UPI00288F0669|nr:FRG domain-containing protein [Vibrio parahaemolyticus]EJC7028132.1 FRG domain-containing protein [Vibrio parahaemolyticus]EJC7177686.1 FRG domain-containing protein [Vibrio parahaemolyticus]EJF4097945.1 FRG domain-containing protein [Vibrio parahaemolyticus]EJX1286223.1 FRG domain-containing protein [Vibrio parahaemolyticus]
MYKIERYRKADKFIEAMSPLRNELISPVPQYVYRGQGNSDWELLPSVLRGTSKLPYRGGRVGPMETLGDQRQMEWELLVNFVKEANINGFHLPDEKVIYRMLDLKQHDKEFNRIRRHETHWPSSEYLSILALAQHYGLPTRFLDWSYSSYVAAYFSAKQCLSALKRGEKVKNLSVYALNSDWSEFKYQSEIPEIQTEIYGHVKKALAFQVVQSPTYFNAHLKAQKGVFTCQYEFGNIKNLPTMSVCLREYIKKCTSERLAVLESSQSTGLTQLRQAIINFDSVVLYEYVLPASKAGDVLYLLDRLGVNASTLFPTLSGCVDTLFERENVY